MSARRLLLAALLLACCKGEDRPLVVGSKNFTESVILGELLAQKLESTGCKVDRRLNMGGTFVCDAAVRAGSIDAYVEYSGTALTAILKRPSMNDRQRVDAIVRADYEKAGLRWSPPLGFNNTFAMIVRKTTARQNELRSISDLTRLAATLRPGFGYEFTERPDGWTGLQNAYNLRVATPPRTMDLGLTYKALASRQVDLIAGNSTDGLISRYGLVQLDDDRKYFPPYDAVPVVRQAALEKHARLRGLLKELGGILTVDEMRKLNYAVDGEKRQAKDVAREFLIQKKFITGSVPTN